MELEFKKFRSDSIRLKDWDYASTGYYFITLCTKNRKPFFGRIIKENVSLSNIGTVCKLYWSEIPHHFTDANIDAYIIMPNHIHGILIINEPNVETCHGMSLQQDPKKNKFSKPMSGSLSVIINQFKSSVTRWCRKNGYINFSWQSRFYDHIIRSERSLEKVREYITYNPLKWESDEYNPKFRS